MYTHVQWYVLNESDTRTLPVRGGAYKHIQRIPLPRVSRVEGVQRSPLQIFTQVPSDQIIIGNHHLIAYHPQRCAIRI